MATLLFKMGLLVMKTVSKPLGDRFKVWVMEHPVYRARVISIAQVGASVGQGRVGFSFPLCPCLHESEGACASNSRGAGGGSRLPHARLS